MTEFSYVVEHTIDVPDVIKVKGKSIKAYIDVEDYGDDYSPSIEYGDEVEDRYDWTILLIADNKGEFLIRLTVNGEIICEDTFYPEDTPIQQMIDRFVETLEGLI